GRRLRRKGSLFMPPEMFQKRQDASLRLLMNHRLWRTPPWSQEIARHIFKETSVNCGLRHRFHKMCEIRYPPVWVSIPNKSRSTSPFSVVDSADDWSTTTASRRRSSRKQSAVP